MVHGDGVVVSLIRSYAAARGISVSYASKIATGSGDTVDRITNRGMSLTARRTEKIINKISDRWPEAAPWPSDIPRPLTSPDRDHPQEAA